MGTIFILVALFSSASFNNFQVGGNSPASTSSATSSQCSVQSLNKYIVDSGALVSLGVARQFTEDSPQFKLASSGYRTSFLNVANLWSFDKSTCIETWDGIGMNYLLSSPNGSLFTLTLGVNPAVNTITDVRVYPQGIANLYTSRNASKTYSGYGIADSSGGTTAVDYALAWWYVPTVYQQSGQTCGTLSAGTACDATVWVGLQNTTYDGPDHLHVNGEVIQTGTEGDVMCSPTCSISYFSWFGYLAATSGGVIKNNTMMYNPCSVRFTTNAGDHMSGVVGSQSEINGTSGNKYYTILTNWTAGKVCESAVTFSHIHEKYGTEHYADFFLERLQHTSTVFNHLAKFSILTFYTVTMGTPNAGSFGAYPDYNSGYGIASYMSNSPTTNTQINPWKLNSGSTSYGHFNMTFLSSSNT